MNNPFGLVQFKQLYREVCSIKGDNVVADIWCAVDDFIAQFNAAEKIDLVLETNGTADFFARLYNIATFCWNTNTKPTDEEAKDYALRILDEAIQDLTP